MDASGTDEIRFLQSLFPHLTLSRIVHACKASDLSSVVNSLLLEGEEENDELLRLKSIFSATDENVLVDAMLASSGLDETINRLLAIESQKSLEISEIILPKRQALEYMSKMVDSAALKSLKSMFPQFDDASISSVLSKHNGNLNEAALELTSFAPQVDIRTAFDSDVKALRDLFPNELTSALIARLHRLKKMHLVVEEILALDSNLMQTAASFATTQSKDTQLQFKFTTTRDSTSQYQRLYSKASLSGGTLEDAQVLRERAFDLMKRRNELYQKAGNKAGRGASSYYAQEGRLLDSQMREVNIQAASAIFAANRRKHNDPNVIDLHGLTIAESHRMISSFVEEWKMTGRGKLRVITGAGNHSASGSRLGPAMSVYFKQMGWKIEEGGNGWFFCRPVV